MPSQFDTFGVVYEWMGLTNFKDDNSLFTICGQSQLLAQEPNTNVDSKQITSNTTNAGYIASRLVLVGREWQFLNTDWNIANSGQPLCKVAYNCSAWSSRHCSSAEAYVLIFNVASLSLSLLWTVLKPASVDISVSAHGLFATQFLGHHGLTTVLNEFLWWNNHVMNAFPIMIFCGNSEILKIYVVLLYYCHHHRHM